MSESDSLHLELLEVGSWLNQLYLDPDTKYLQQNYKVNNYLLATFLTNPVSKWKGKYI